MNSKKCFRCGKDIDIEVEDYFIFTEINKRDIVKVDHCHKICWNTFLEKVGDVSEAKGMLKGLKNYLRKLGVVEEEYVVG